MKPTYLLALTALGFTTGAIILGLNRGTVDAGTDKSASSAQPAVTPPAERVLSVEPSRSQALPPQQGDLGAAERNLQNARQAAQNKDYGLALSYVNERLYGFNPTTDRPLKNEAASITV